jgi:hypothetical protein
MRMPGSNRRLMIGVTHPYLLEVLFEPSDVLSLKVQKFIRYPYRKLVCGAQRI